MKEFLPATGMRDVQKRFVTEIVASRRSMLAARYGVGKTWVALELMRREHIAQSADGDSLFGLVFCKPHNVVTWKQEALKRTRGIRVITDVNEFRISGSAIVSDMRNTLVILPHDKLKQFYKEIMAILHKHRPGAVIVDECTRIKNHSTQRAKAFHSLREALPSSVPCVTLTGNPMPENPTEIWSQFQFCYGKRNPLGDTYYRFLRKWFVRHQYGYALSLDLEDTFYELLADWALYLTPEERAAIEAAEGLQEPTYISEMYEESAEQRQLLDFLYEHWELPARYDEALPDDPTEEEIREILENDLDVEEYNYTMSVASKAQQISSGFYYDSEGEPNWLARNTKLEHLVELITQLLQEKPERQIIVWAHFRASYGAIEKALENAHISCVIGPVEESMLLFGMEQEEEERQEWPHAAITIRRPSVIVMPCSQSEGHNLLSNADVAIWYENIYSQEKRDQAEARNSGFRQKHPEVLLIDLISPRQADAEIVNALIGKNLTPARLKTIVRKNFRKEEK